MTTGPETDLYGPVKDLLEAQGYAVKGEVGGCDLLAVRGDEPPVIVELKRRFTLDLVLQGVNRLAVTDLVYLAVPQPGRRTSPSPYDSDIRKLCRRLGVGLLVVDPARAAGHRVDVLCDPTPYAPRRDRKRLGRLLGEHRRRVGDPNRGGSTRQPIVTAYRQDALRCARLLQVQGTMTLAALRAAGAPADVATILRRDVYAWFERVGRGTYRLREEGARALDSFRHALDP
ncbi:hypothetical protein HL658_00150 [Azospirillum sp. RWY-5-1]|uniref:Uncharacterized protein n=1 Tax=Azospirillum oleiclasticum TaxID=2735135 RepID=A0ABX2T1B4_9PROT|nr:hypothetical protein [Azospirillum oleiclasticum]NYZ18105.1 hypothetical protein [Azospirillum oleiclasticum]